MDFLKFPPQRQTTYVANYVFYDSNNKIFTLALKLLELNGNSKRRRITIL